MESSKDSKSKRNQTRGSLPTAIYLWGLAAMILSHFIAGIVLAGNPYHWLIVLLGGFAGVFLSWLYYRDNVS